MGVVPYGHACEHDGVDGGEDVGDAEAVVADEDRPQEEDQGEDQVHDELGESKEYTRYVSFLDGELVGQFEPLRVLVEDHVLVAEGSYCADVDHRFSDQTRGILVGNVSLCAEAGCKGHFNGSSEDHERDQSDRNESSPPLVEQGDDDACQQVGNVLNNDADVGGGEAVDGLAVTG